MKFLCIVFSILLIGKCDINKNKAHVANLNSIHSNGTEIYDFRDSKSGLEYYYILPNGVNEADRLSKKDKVANLEGSEIIQINGNLYQVEPSYMVAVESWEPRDSQIHMKWHISGVLDSSIYFGEKYYFIKVRNQSYTDYFVANQGLKEDMEDLSEDSISFYVHFYKYSVDNDSIYHNIVVEDEWHEDVDLFAIDTTITYQSELNIRDSFPIASNLVLKKFHLHINPSNLIDTIISEPVPVDNSIDH